MASVGGRATSAELGTRSTEPGTGLLMHAGPDGPVEPSAALGKQDFFLFTGLSAQRFCQKVHRGQSVRSQNYLPSKQACIIPFPSEAGRLSLHRPVGFRARPIGDLPCAGTSRTAQEKLSCHGGHKLLSDSNFSIDSTHIPRTAPGPVLHVLFPLASTTVRSLEIARLTGTRPRRGWTHDARPAQNHGSMRVCLHVQAIRAWAPLCLMSR